MFIGQPWYEYLDESMKDLVDMAYYIYDREAMRSEELHDYSFVVFPMAKAFEGYLKKYLHDIGLISTKEMMSKHLRIGSSLNPDLPKIFRREGWLVDDLTRFCQRSTEAAHHKLADLLWNTWVKCRNRLFHYYPEHIEFISLSEAWNRLNMVKDAMAACMDCRTNIFRQGEKIDK